MRRWLVPTVVLALAASALAAIDAHHADDIGLPAKIVDLTPDIVRVSEYATTDFTPEDGPVDTTTQWRVTTGTGNAAESWVTTTPEGRIYDLGGRYLNYSDDDGQTWKSVQPQDPLINGEGSVVVAPNGDILGVTWDPYAGDRVWTYKYSKAEDAWYYSQNVFHTPFWDRPGIDVVPGEFTDPLGNTSPYIVFINGFPHNIWHYSYDGLNYPYTTELNVDRRNNQDAPVNEWLDIEPDPSYDWIQPNTYFAFAALGDGDAVMGSLYWESDDMSWHPFTLGDGSSLPNGGRIQTDSLGRLHTTVRVADGFEYRVSDDGGRTWKATFAGTGSPGDFRANAEVGVAAVWALEGTQDLLYKFDISGDAPVLTHRHVIGRGDDSRTGGIGFYGLTGGHRYDFPSVGILPDGRAVLSFMDTSTTMSFPTLGTHVVSPGLAIELPAPEAPTTSG
ncbi:MAG: hypothetical protein KY469_07160 [Actinobacteria bacterium]|nr:hypothetical protein [Actinomycetota bacterium]